MSKTYRLRFDKGINVVGDKAILPDGFCTVMDNVDLRSGSIRPYRAPEIQFQAAPTNTRAWSYRGRWFLSDGWRDYVGEYIGGIERVYYTEEGKIPTKSIEGVEAALGTPRPKSVLAVTKTTSLAPPGLSATVVAASGSLAAGARTYRVSAKNADGILPPTGPITATIAASGSSVKLSWGGVPDITGYVIWEGDENNQQVLDEVPSTITTYTDAGAKTASGSSAPEFFQNQSFEYSYTYLRNVNGVMDESGMASASVPVVAATGRLISRDFLNDGYFDQKQSDGVTSAASTGTAHIGATSASSFPPKTIGGTTVTYQAFNRVTSFLLANHGYQTGQRLYFTGFTDVKYQNVELEITRIDANHFGVTGLGLPSDVNTSTNILTGSQTVQVCSSIVQNDTVVNATNTTKGIRYVINVVGTTDFTLIGASANTVGVVFVATGVGAGTGTVTPVVSYPTLSTVSTLATALVPGMRYVISSLGSTNFTTVGAISNTVGTQFTATDVATGTGVVYGVISNDDAVYLVGTSPGQSPISDIYKATYINPTQFTIPVRATQASGSISLTTMKWVQGNGFYSKWNLYRNEQGIWALVESIDIYKSTYTDAKPFAALGGPPTSFYLEGGLTVDYDTPPLGLTNIETHYAMKFGIVGHSVRWTPSLQPDAWPEIFSISLPYKPVALASFSQGLIILCQDAIYRLDGNTPTSLSLSKTHAEDGCFFPYSVQKTDKGLIYVAKRGVMLFDGMRAVCLTDTRVKGDTLIAPSTLINPYNFWWMPTIMTRNYADLAGEDGILGTQYSYTLDNTNVIEGYSKDVKSFYFQGKYYLFYTGPNYQANTSVCMDMQLEGFPLTTLGMKILDAHVNETEQCFILCDNAPPNTVVTITSPV